VFVVSCTPLAFYQRLQPQKARGTTVSKLDFNSQLSVDLDVDGRQIGSLCVPTGSVANPLAQQAAPLLVLRRGDGPVICLVSGTRSGDVTGSTVLQSLAQELAIANINGTLILCPALTPTMDSQGELDGTNNALLQEFAAQILPSADVIVEFVSGAISTHSAPHAAVWPGDDNETAQLAEAMMIAFGAPDSVRRFDVPVPGSLASISAQLNTPYFQVDIGHFASTDRTSRLMSMSGCRNLLLHTKVLSEGHFDLRSTRMLEISKPCCRVATPVRGLVQWHTELGGAVHLGNPLAEIFDPHRPFAKPIAIDAPMNGVLLSKQASALVTSHHCLALIGDEVPR